MQARSSAHHHFSGILSWLYRAFDAVATWVTQLSWWKFFLFAALLLIAGAILQEELFSGGEVEVAAADRSARREQPSILIDDSGIHFNPRNKPRAATPAVPPTVPETPETPPAPAAGAKGTAPDLALPKGVHPNGDAVHIELPPQIAEELVAMGVKPLVVVYDEKEDIDRAQFPEEIVWLHKPITNAQLLAAVEKARGHRRPGSP